MTDNHILALPEYFTVKELWEKFDPKKEFPHLDEPMESVVIVGFLGFLEEQLDIPRNSLAPYRDTMHEVVLSLQRHSRAHGSPEPWAGG